MLNQVIEQIPLMEGGRGLSQQQPVSDEVIFKQPTKLAAINLSIQVSGKEHKEIYMALGIDKATWSNILSGKFGFPTNKEELFMDAVENDILLIWMAYRRGKKLEPMEDAQAKRIRELEEMVADKNREIDTLVKYGVLNRK